MAVELAKAYVQIIPSAKGIKGSIAKEIAPEAEDSGAKSGGGFAKAFLGKSASVIAAGSAAVTGAAAAIWSQANATAAAADNIDKMSQKIGISTDAYQEWAFVMEHSGTSVDNLQAGMKTLAGVIVDAEAGSKGATEKLHALGLSVKDLAGMSQEQQLDVVISRLQDMGNGAERTAAATDLLGKSATDMAALLNMSSEETAAMRQQVHDLGGVMSEEAVKAGATFEDNLLNLQTAFKGLGTNLTGQFLPSMNQVMEGLTMLVSGDSSGLGMINEGIRAFLDKMIAAGPEMIDTVSKIMQGFFDVIIDNLPHVIAMGIELILKLIVGILQASPELIKKAPEIVWAVVTGLRNALPEIKSAGSDLVRGIWDGILAAKDWLFGMVSGFVGGIVDTIKGKLGIHSPSTVMRDAVGRYIPAGIAVGIEQYGSLVDDAMDELADGLTTNATATVRAGVEVGATSYPPVRFATGGTGTDAGRIYALLAQYLPLLANMQVVLDSGEVVGVLDALLGERIRRRRLA